MNKNDFVRSVEDFTGEKMKGGEKTLLLLERAQVKGRLRLFLPWAAPADGRSAVGKEDVKTIEWLFSSNGLINMFSNNIGRTDVIWMPADSYARRNGFNMEQATRYWSNIRSTIENFRNVISVPASVIEDQPVMSSLSARSAYALEKLRRGTEQKVTTSARKYGDSSSSSTYELAGEYAMRRAAEALFVEEELGALWVSLNWPERDAMCGSTPRLYVPEEIRAPWLKDVA
jgi:hypothetical protein